MVDKPLPWPTPRWHDPIKPDLSMDEIDAIAKLNRAADGIKFWAIAAYRDGISPADWNILGGRLADVVNMCFGLGGPAPDSIEPSDT